MRDTGKCDKTYSMEISQTREKNVFQSTVYGVIHITTYDLWGIVDIILLY